MRKRFLKLSPRFAGYVRLDARVYLGAHGVDNLLDTSATVLPASTAGSVASITTPAIQFGNAPTTGIQSSLSGTALDGFRAFAGGLQSQVSITMGIFWRF